MRHRVGFLFDEIKFLAKPELEALIGAVHRTVQRQLPVTFAGAGLPELPGLAGAAKSYAEGISFDREAIDFILDYSEGYPYFTQEFGRSAWNTAEGPVMTRVDATDALSQVESELDGIFFLSRVKRITPEELRYLRAMAERGNVEQKASDVAAVLHRSTI